MCQIVLDCCVFVFLHTREIRFFFLFKRQHSVTAWSKLNLYSVLGVNLIVSSLINWIIFVVSHTSLTGGQTATICYTFSVSNGTPGCRCLTYGYAVVQTILCHLISEIIRVNIRKCCKCGKVGVWSLCWIFLCLTCMTTKLLLFDCISQLSPISVCCPSCALPPSVLRFHIYRNSTNTPAAIYFPR